MEGDFFLSIRDRLRTQVAAIKFFDIYRGQFEPNDQGEVQISHRPCVFIEMGEEQSSTVGQKVQRCELPFAIYVVTDTVKEWSAEQSDAQAAIEINTHTTLCRAVKRALVNYRGPHNNQLYAGGIIKTGGKSLQVRQGHIVSVIYFKVLLTDNSATNTPANIGSIDTINTIVNYDV